MLPTYRIAIFTTHSLWRRYRSSSARCSPRFASRTSSASLIFSNCIFITVDISVIPPRIAELGHSVDSRLHRRKSVCFPAPPPPPVPIGCWFFV